MKGATNVAEYDAQAPKSSIHAPVKGATLAYVEFQFDKANFNPRSREGSDGRDGAEGTQLWIISIHAPVKGAT